MTIDQLLADLAYIVEDAPVFERYYAGGFGSLRGFKYRTVSPRQGVKHQPVGGNFIFWEAAMQRHELADAIQRTLVRGIAYFGESVAVEALVWAVAIRRSPGLQPRHLVLAIVAANAVTYVILIPLLATALIGGDLL